MRFVEQRVVALMVAILAAAFLAISLLSYKISSDSVRKNLVDQQLPLTGDNVYSEIQRDLLRPIHVAQQMAHDTFLLDWVLAGEQDPPQLVRYLARIKTQFGASTSFFISERTRKYYYADGILKTVSESDPRDQWYFRVRSMKEPYKINVDVDKAHHDTLTTFIDFRVYDYADRYLGVAGVGIPLTAMRGLIQRYEEKYQRRVFFLDANGGIALAGETMNPRVTSIRDLPGLAQLAPKILNSSKEPARLSYSNADGTVQLNSRFIPELHWYLIVEESEAALVNPLHSMLAINILISVVATLLVLGAAGALLKEVSVRRKAQEALLATKRELSELAQELMLQEKTLTHGLAQSLHDQLGQTLAASRLRLDALLARHGSALSDDARQEVARLATLLEQAVHQVRQTLVDLHPPLLSEQGLEAALDNEIRSGEADGESVDVRLEVDSGGTRWPADVEYSAFMIAREAIANALQHANATLVRVRLGGKSGLLTLDVVDDGIGIALPMDGARPGHLGMVGMRERALAVKARFAIEQAAQGGTHVSLRWEESVA